VGEDGATDSIEGRADVLEPTIAEIEAHVHAAGWDRPPVLFALVPAGRFVADDPQTATRLGIDAQDADALTPIEQEELPDEPLDALLAGIAWPDAVAGCALSQEIVVLPPGVEAQLAADAATDPDGVARALVDHPARREARLVVAVLRDGTSAALIRLRAAEESADSGDDLLTGPDLAPNLVTALHATFD
jgi:hypothetical protein